MRIFHSGLSRNFDGPGERLVFYLKGCNFHCDWCGSPESISPKTQLLYYPERNRDILCRNCPYHAYADAGNLQRAICSECRTFDCVKIWRNPAFELAGVCGFDSCITVPKVTKDGVFVCIHDDTINKRARDHSGNMPQIR